MYVELGLVGRSVLYLDQGHAHPWIQHYELHLQVVRGEGAPVVQSLDLHINSEVDLLAHIE